MAKTLDDIFNDDEFGILDAKETKSLLKTDRDRLVESFEEINTFYSKNKREPSGKGMSEMRLMMRLKGFREDAGKKQILKSYDQFNILGPVIEKKQTIDDILDDDDLGLLDSEADTSIFNFTHTPKPEKRADSDFVAQREPIKEEEFKKYQTLFQQVHKDLKEGKRKLLDFVNIEKNLQVGNYYVLDGLLLYLESAEIKHEFKEVKSGGRMRIDGRTVTIFENGTRSNMLYRSLGKSIQKSGKLVTQPLFGYSEPSASTVNEEDVESGWIYILKSRSPRKELKGLSNLYKVGYTITDVKDRIKNAKKEATYLFDDVEVVASYKCYNLNAQKFENLIHRFLGDVCLNLDIYNQAGQRANPREWFVAPLSIINKTIELIISGDIVNYRYDTINKQITHKQG